MAYFCYKLRVVASAVILLVALLVAAPAFAVSGDYGVNTRASAASGCGGTSQPACNITVNGYDLTYSHTQSDGTQVYTFDDFSCTLYLHANGNSSGRGSECDQYQP